MQRAVRFAYLAEVALLAALAQNVPTNRKRGASAILVPGKDWQLLGEGYQLTADSAVDNLGNIYFTDQPNNQHIPDITRKGSDEKWLKDPAKPMKGCLVTEGEMGNEAQEHFYMETQGALALPDEIKFVTPLQTMRMVALGFAAVGVSVTEVFV